VTILNVVYLGVMISMLMFGRHQGWPALRTLAAAQLASAVLHLALLAVVYAACYRLPAQPEHEDLTYGEVLAFFWPAAVTSLMFALSRPVLYAFLNRTADAVDMIAAMRVAFDFALFFQLPLNQFRHLFITFGGADPAGVRRFMVRVMLVATALMTLVAFTPLSTLYIDGMLGVKGRPMTLAVQALMALCATPLVITIRNYFHGELLHRRRTGGMAVGGLFRVGAMYAASWGLFALGLLNHAASAAVLQVGFLVEGLVCAAFLRRAVASAAKPPVTVDDVDV
jgi:hypothetical protein